ncbi:MAG: YbhB/YbcL family Raf kinase inhibitor-like protein [Bifidobacteriaceae bacterium]|nr:YbhB/YbcL family Raf kinase inhibitor-like protein [Bifidobacteriaceae bacterium]
MHILTDFEVIPDAFSKYAPEQNKIDGHAVVSFPFKVEGIAPGFNYLHIAFTDPDSIPVAGFAWIHWCAANIRISDASRNALIPEDFSRNMKELSPESCRGKNSLVSRFVGQASSPASSLYIGPTPPDKTHFYLLRVWATEEKLDLKDGFYLSDLLHSLLASGSAPDASSTLKVPQACALLAGRA